MENSTVNPELYPPAFITVIFMDCLGLFLAVTLNGCHLIILTYSFPLFSQNLRLCLRVLAVFDILGGLVCYGMEILVYFNRDIVIASLVGCNIAAATCTIFVGVSQFILFVITIDRYVAVARPLQYYNILTRTRIRISLLVALVVGASAGMVRSIHGTLIDYCDFIIDGPELFTQPIMAIYHVAPLSLVIVTTLLNARLLCIARAQAKRDKLARQSSVNMQSRDYSTDAHDTELNSFSERCKSAITISAMVGASYLVWMPYLILTIICLFERSNLSFVWKAAMYWSMYATFWFNPIVFGLVSSNYKNAVVRLVIKVRLVKS